MNKAMLSILKILDRQTDVLGSREISRELRLHGIEIKERMVRYYMRILDARGHTVVFGKEGRRITDKGRTELGNAFVSEKVGFVISTIEKLSYLTTLSMDSMQGDVILNISCLPEKRCKEAMKTLRRVFHSPYIISEKVIIARGGRMIGDVPVPDGKVAIGTVCSVTINGIFLKAGIPVTSRFGGLVEIRDGSPERFTSLISYEGSSLDPLEVFIKSGMTDVLGAVRKNSGTILASFREIPVVCLDEANALAKKLSAKGMRGIIAVGKPNTPLLGVPVGIDKAGIVIAGGLNPVAAVEESGICTENAAMSALYDYSKLGVFDEAVRAFV